MKRRAGVVLATLLLAAQAGATGEERQSFDPIRSQAVFKVGMRLPMKVEGRFDRTGGELVRLADGRFRVHARLDGRDLRMSGPEWVQRMTLSGEFLDVGRHPEIRFDSSAVEARLLREGGRLRGRLQLRGQAKDVAFDLLPPGCARPGADCDIQVVGRLNRHDFGMHRHRFSVRDQIGFEFRIRLAGPPR